MTENAPSTEPMKKSCGGCINSLNYCLCAKILVGIPAMTICAYIASTPFNDGMLKLVAAVATVGVMTYLAIKIDQIPALSKKIVDRSKP